MFSKYRSKKNRFENNNSAASLRSKNCLMRPFWHFLKMASKVRLRETSRIVPVFTTHVNPANPPTPGTGIPDGRLPKLPSMSPTGFAGAAVLMLLAVGYALRRRY